MNKVKNIVSCGKTKRKKNTVLLFNFPDALMFNVKNKHDVECLM